MTLGNAAYPSGKVKGAPVGALGHGDHQLSAMILDLDETESAALVTLLRRAVDGDLIGADLYPLSRRVMVLKEILGKLRPEPARPAASPEPKVYAPPSRGRYRTRG